MSQEQEVSEFEEEMSEQVAAQAKGEEAEPEPVEPEKATEPEKAEEKTEKPEESTTDSKKDEWTLTAVMDEREKRQKAVKEADELREKLKAFEKPEDDVSIFEDEAAWKAKQDEKLTTLARDAALNASRGYAAREFGMKKIVALEEWMQSEGIKSPYVVEKFNAAIGSAEDSPYHVIADFYDADQVMRNPDSVREQIRQEEREKLQAGNKSEKKPEKSIAPSLASKRSAGEPSRFPDNPEDILGE